MASWPTTIWFPFEYWARSCPPLATATCTSCAAGAPSCATADMDDGCAYWVSRGDVPLNKFQLMVRSEAPSLRPVICSCGEGSVEAGVIRLPLLLKLTLPVRGVKGGVCMSASG